MSDELLELEELAARVEAARVPDRKLDMEIKAAVHGAVALMSPFNGEWCLYRAGTTDPRGGKSYERPRHIGHTEWKADSYTASLDAAVTLVPATADAAGELYRVEAYNSPGVLPAYVRASAWVAGAARVYAASAPLALTAAALRARASHLRMEVE